MKVNVRYKILILIILICTALSLPGFTSELPVSRQTVVENPDPLRFKEEISAFTSWDQKNSFPLQGLLFVGSSSIRLWQTHEAFPEYPLLNRGFGGAHISDVLYFYQRIVKKYQPRLIVFYAGDNDVAAGKSPGQVFSDFKKFFTLVQADFQETLVIFLPIKPSVSRWNFWEVMQKANHMIENYAAEHKNLYFVETDTPLLGSDGKPDAALYLGDGLHLNKKGYERWEKVLTPVLRELYVPDSK